MKNLDRDKIDYSKTDITKLFFRIFIPTLLGMISNSILNIADGIMVGKGVGSDALAAVNITASLYLISAAIGLTFGAGASIVAAIHLSKGNIKAANINITQALQFPLIIMVIISISMLLFTKELNIIFGGSEILFPLVRDYMIFLCPMPIFYFIELMGTFIIRLDGSPRYAMTISIIPAIINIFLDWMFIFPMGMGIKGAAIATSLSMVISASMTIIYLTRYTRKIHLYKIKYTRTSLYLTARNLWEMLKIGSATFVEEISIGAMIITGNHMFMSLLKEDGVAAFSVVCYLTPILFMFGHSVAQSQMPIISYNLGLKDIMRIKQTIKISLITATILGCLIMVLAITGNEYLMMLFLKKGTTAYQIATDGFPLFTLGICIFTINLVVIGIYQSLKYSKKAILYTILKGIILLIPCFIIIPKILGDKGLWLAVPICEAITFIIMITDYRKSVAKIN